MDGSGLFGVPFLPDDKLREFAWTESRFAELEEDVPIPNLESIR